jgi:hypothetical protein
MSKGWTFQSLIDDKMSVTAYCHKPACHHKQELDLKASRPIRPGCPGDGVGHQAEASLQEVRGQ